MSRATLCLLDPQIQGPWPDGYTVVARFDDAIGDGDSSRGLDMNSISVGAEIWSHDLHITHLHILAAIDHQMH